MRRGSVVVDLAAENGGNVESTEKDKVVVTPQWEPSSARTSPAGYVATASAPLRQQRRQISALRRSPDWWRARSS